MKTLILSFAAMLLCFVCSAGVLYISHRGESADAPENTMAAFRLAWERGTDGIECDVHRTADGRPQFGGGTAETRRRQLPWQTVRRREIAAVFGASRRHAGEGACLH